MAYYEVEAGLLVRIAVMKSLEAISSGILRGRGSLLVKIAVMNDAVVG